MATKLEEIQNKVDQLALKVAGIDTKVVSARAVTYGETNVDKVLTDLLGEVGHIWIGIGDKKTSTDRPLRARDIPFDDITHFGLATIQDAIEKLFVANRDRPAAPESQARGMRAAQREVKSAAWGVQKDNEEEDDPTGVNDPIFRHGPVVIGANKSASRGLHTENVGNLGNGDGNHTITGQFVMATGKTHLVTADQAFAFGENNSAKGKNVLVGGEQNQAAGENSAVVSGSNNTISAKRCFVGSGDTNRVTQEDGVIGGGSQNHVGRPHGFIGAGFQNRVQGEAGTVPGGYQNQANGDYSTVPGGIDNIANGKVSLALGAHSRASHDGSLIWHDATAANFSSVTENEGAFFGAGGFRFRTDFTGTLGVDLPPGGNGWIIACPVTDQENIVEIDSARVLSALADVPVRVYSYPSYLLDRRTAEVTRVDRAETHVLHNFGTNAADWDARFGELLGRKTLKQTVINEGQETVIELPGISTGDQVGVLIVAVQELTRLVQAQASRIKTLEKTKV